MKSPKPAIPTAAVARAAGGIDSVAASVGAAAVVSRQEKSDRRLSLWTAVESGAT